MNKPFTYEQAEEICEDFEDLIDTELVIDGQKYFVDKLLIVPFDNEARDRFMKVYYTSGNVTDNPDLNDANEYDVLFIASSTDNPGNTTTQFIRDYIANNGVIYNFPE